MEDDTTMDAQDATSGSPSSGDQTDDTSQADAGTTDQPGSADTTPGPIPFQEHKRILENARRDYEERYGWAQDLNRNDVENWRRIAAAIDSNPKAVAKWLSDNLGDNGEPPRPNLQTEDGRALYDAEQAQALVNYHLNALRRELGERFGPIESEIAEKRTADLLSTQIDEAMSWRGFEDNLDKITDAIVAAQQQGRPISLAQAYINVVVPKVRAEERRAVTKEIKDKSGASDNLRPGRQRSQAAKPDSERSLSELIREEMAAKR